MSVRRARPSPLSNDFSSEAIWPIAFILYIIVSIGGGGERKIKSLIADRNNFR